MFQTDRFHFQISKCANRIQIEMEGFIEALQTDPRSHRPPIDGRTKHCLLSAANACNRQDSRDTALQWNSTRSTPLVTRSMLTEL